MPARKIIKNIANIFLHKLDANLWKKSKPSNLLFLRVQKPDSSLEKTIDPATSKNGLNRCKASLRNAQQLRKRE
jgi:hypothetical protein